VPAIDDRCSLRSLAAEEPLAGTASTIRHWLLIEHPGPWGRDGLLDARLPTDVGRDLRALEARSGARVLLIRAPGRKAAGDAGPVRCFAVDTRDAWLGSEVVDRIEETVDLDPLDRTSFRDDPDGGPLFVVCTHGRRDPCCAERGRPVAAALADRFPDRTWESTHVGGDRFAGNLVAFPHGAYFGRVEPSEAPAIADRYAEGRIGSLDRYRGRSCDPIAVQAAERAVREHLQLDRIDDVAPVDVRRRGDRATVVFTTPTGRRTVRVQRSAQAPMRLTCHATVERSRTVWTVLGIDREDEA
jgi:hypothetical protein